MIRLLHVCQVLNIRAHTDFLLSPFFGWGTREVEVLGNIRKLESVVSGTVLEDISTHFQTPLTWLPVVTELENPLPHAPAFLTVWVVFWSMTCRPKFTSWLLSLEIFWWKNQTLHIFPLSPASKGAIVPGTTLRQWSDQLGTQSGREKELSPLHQPQMPLFTLSVSWRQCTVLYLLTPLRQTFCYLEPKVFLTDTALRPGFQLGNLIWEPGSRTPFLPASLFLGLSSLWPHWPLSSSKPPCFYLPPESSLFPPPRGIPT